MKMLTQKNKQKQTNNKDILNEFNHKTTSVIMIDFYPFLKGLIYDDFLSIV